MSIGVRVSGSWKDVNAVSVKVSGAWKNVDQAYVKVSGVWRPLLTPDIVLGTISNYTNTGATPYTATGLASIASDERAMIYIAGDGASRTINSVTVGGQAAVVVGALNFSANATIALYLAPVGATGNVVVTLSGNWSRISVSALPTKNIQSATPTSIVTDTTNPFSQNINCEAGGAVFGVAYHTDAGSFTWSGITEQFDNNPSAGRTASGAASAFASAQTNLTVTATPAGGTSAGMMLVALR